MHHVQIMPDTNSTSLAKLSRIYTRLVHIIYIYVTYTRINVRETSVSRHHGILLESLETPLISQHSIVLRGLRVDS